VLSSAFWIPGQARNGRRPFKNVISMNASYEKSYASVPLLYKEPPYQSPSFLKRG